MRYAGELYFSDDDIIDVDSLIIRSKSEISYSFLASWDGQGKWRKSGTALFDGQNFVSDDKPSTQLETGKIGPSCKIIFSEIEPDGSFLVVAGEWHESGKSFPFGGDLEIQR